MKKNLRHEKVELVRNWFDNGSIIKTLLLFAYAFLIIEIWLILMEDPDNDAFLPVLLSVISLMVLCYLSLAGLVNKTKIIIGNQSVQVRNYPLPFPGGKTFMNSNVVEYHTRSTLNPKRIFQRVKFEIHALTDYGQRFEVLTGISRLHQAELIRIELSKVNCIRK